MPSATLSSFERYTRSNGPFTRYANWLRAHGLGDRRQTPQETVQGVFDRRGEDRVTLELIERVRRLEGLVDDVEWSAPHAAGQVSRDRH